VHTLPVPKKVRGGFGKDFVDLRIFWIELTISTYGRWLKKKAPGALDRLDISANVASGSKAV